MHLYPCYLVTSAPGFQLENLNGNGFKGAQKSWSLKGQEEQTWRAWGISRMTPEKLSQKS